MIFYASEKENKQNPNQIEATKDPLTDAAIYGLFWPLLAALLVFIILWELGFRLAKTISNRRNTKRKRG